MKFQSKNWFVLLMAVFMGFCSEPEPPPVAEEQPESVRPILDITADLKSGERQKVTNALLELMRAEKEVAPIKEVIAVYKNGKDEGIKLTAAMCLAHFKVKEAAPFLSADLSRGKISSPDLLIDALGQLEDARYAGPVLPYLKHENHTYRLKAVEALERMKAKNMGGRILAMAQSEKREEYVKTYAMALGKVAYTPGETWLLQKLSRTTEGPDRAAVLLALGRVKSTKAIPALVKHITEPFEKGRENASLALIEIDNISAHKLLATAFEKRTGETDTDSDIRKRITDVIVHRNVPATAKRFHEIFLKAGGLQSSDSAVLLGKLQHQDSTPEIMRRLADIANMGREDLARALGYMGDKRAETVLLQVLKEKEGKGRYGAVWSAGVLKLKSALPQLREMVRNDDQYLAGLAIEALGAMQDPGALPDLKKSLEKNSNLAVYSASAIALIPGNEARDILLENAARGEVAIRKACLEALATRKDLSTVKPLVKMLTKAEPELRAQFYYTLQAITGKKIRSVSGWEEYVKGL